VFQVVDGENHRGVVFYGMPPMNFGTNLNPVLGIYKHNGRIANAQSGYHFTYKIVEAGIVNQVYFVAFVLSVKYG
jgi:hypothetical protein